MLFGGGAGEGHLRPGHIAHIGVGDQFGVAGQQEGAFTSDLLQRCHRTGHLRHLGGATVAGPVEDRDAAVGTGPDPGLDLLQIPAAVLRVTGFRRCVLLIHLWVGAVEGDRGHVPVDPGNVQAELLDRRYADGAGDLVQLRGDGVQGAAGPVVVEDLRSDPEAVFHGPFACPVDDADQRCRGGQPAGDHGFDDLAVGSQRDIADRAEPIDDRGNAELVQKRGDHGQTPERLLDTRRSVDGGFRHATYRDRPHAERHLETLTNQDTVKLQRAHTTASAEDRASARKALARRAAA